MFIFAVLALVASTEGFPGLPQGNVLKDICERNGVDYANVEIASTQFEKCIQNSVDTNMFEIELSVFHDEGQLKKVFQKYCAKTPELKTCYHTYFDVVFPCAGGEKFNITNITKNAIDKVLDYVCFNGGDPITLFIVNDGLECLESKMDEILKCGDGILDNYMGLATHPKEPATFIAEFEQCMVLKLKRCDSPVPANFFQKVFEIIGNDINQILQALQGLFQEVALTMAMEDFSLSTFLNNQNDPELQENTALMRNILCEQNGVSYRNVEGLFQEVALTMAMEDFSLSTFLNNQNDPELQENTALMRNILCEQNGVSYRNVEAATNEFITCLENSDGNTIVRDLMLAKDERQYKRIFKKICTKSPQIKSCYHTFYDVVGPCADGGRHHATRTIKSVTDQMLDYACSNETYPITSFMVNHGPQCIDSKEVKMCGIRYMKDFTTLPMSSSVYLRLTDELMQCVVQKLKTGDKSVTDFIKKIFEIVRGGLIEVVNNTASGLTVSSRFILLVLLPPIYCYIHI